MKNNVVNNKKICVTLQQFKDFFLTHNYNDNMFNSDGSINTKYNSNKETGAIAQIFEEHWVKFYIENKIMVNTYRTNASFEIQKVIDCFNKDLGCSAYDCPKCSTRMNFLCFIT